MTSCSVRQDRLDDISRMWAFLRENRLEETWRKLRRASAGRLFLDAVIDWLAIAAAFACVGRFGLVAGPIAALVVGNRQRALGNLLHDAAHGCYGLPRGLGDALAQGVLFLPLWTSLALYRREHFAHHRRLGDPDGDADFIHRDADLGGCWRAVYLRVLLDRGAFAGSVSAHLRRASKAELAAMCGWWTVALGALAATIGVLASAEFLALWIVSRATSFHAITTFREISDHVGLRPGAILGFSRNHLARGALAALFHPHNNGFHLVHHLDPALPYTALPAAHRILMAWPNYRSATHTELYFRGNPSLVRSWLGARPLDPPASASSAATSWRRSILPWAFSGSASRIRMRDGTM